MKTLLLIIGLALVRVLDAQVWTNPITGTNPSTSNPYTTGQTVAPNLTVSGIGRGSGITSSNFDDRYAASDWSTGALDLNDYFNFTLTPDPGYWINLSSFVYTSQGGVNQPTLFAVRSSLDNYTTDIGTPTGTGGTISLGSPDYINLTSPISFRIYGWGAGGAGANFGINDFTFNGATALPIQLSSFDVTLNKNPFLEWTTLSELNNSYFSIEHSLTGSNFIEIAKVKGQGTSDKLNYYSYVDLSSNKGLNYYRLKGVDLDERFTFYPIKSVYVPFDYFSVYPTLFDQEVTLQFLAQDEKSVKWSLQDAFGRTVQSGHIATSQGVQQLSLYGINSGVYFLVINSNRGLKSKKLIKL